MARAQPVPGLSAEGSYASAAATVVSVRSRELTEHSRGVLDRSDVERVHDMRVATRRLRAALEVFEPCFPRKRLKAALAEVKGLADALGERRDRDVAIAALEEFAEGMAAPDRRGISDLIVRLRAEQSDANAALEPFVQPERLRALGERLSQLALAAESLEGREQA
jgi:CHAD domain-containing protein